ncbi:hypothetical protein GOBAR_AA07426 [Gossypium barbadense]|uniref:tRNA (adenine(58)-N(1))-methyltransferase catalytic subunit TRM61 C-terminal domain-containing protein n=1 Tax=Gossypium barbadense TaxID=3634 RepID=A0A2P5YCE3_GOSBA|nr:hypothetical protein GOBAR_AA07426 [Gossypium barbadense]
MAGPASSESEVILKILFGYYGGWTAPNIYFLGFAGVVKFGNIRIGGLSGIYYARRQDVWEYDPVLFNGTQAEYEANRVENVARANADHNQVDDTWERVKEVGLRGLTSKRHMKIVLRWMRERQKIRLICNVVGPHKKFLLGCSTLVLAAIPSIAGHDQTAYLPKSELAPENLEKVRYDLKEIAFPSSLPDPPHIKKCCKLTWHELFLVLKEASRLYAASWVRDIGADLRPNDYKKDDGTEGKSNGDRSRSTETEPSTLEDIGEELYSVSHYSDDRTVILCYLAIAARGGIETLRPALQRLYMTRASAYRDALKSFIEGYQEVECVSVFEIRQSVAVMLRSLKIISVLWNLVEDFERTGISTLITVGVRDIQGKGFPDQFSGLADSVFLDLPQPWLAIPSA